MKIRRSRHLFALFAVVMLLGSFALAGCSGTTQIDLNLDEEGSGTIEITGNGEGEQEDSSAAESGSTGSLDSQTLLFVVVIAIFLGVLAIVVAASRRPRTEHVIHEERRRDDS